MRVLVLPDRQFLQRERTLLARLEVGMADEGARVLHAVPEGWRAEGEMIGLYSTRVSYADSGLPLTLGLRADKLISDLVSIAAPEPDERIIDLVHAFGEGSWRLGAEVCARTGAMLMLEAWRPSCGAEVSRAVARLGAGRVVVATADPALNEPLRAAAAGATIHETPWGVHSVEGHAGRVRGRVPTVAVVASGEDVASMSVVLGALSRCAPPGEESEPLIFVDAQAARRAGVWGVASTLGIQSRLSVIADLEGRRELVLQADVLVCPESRGEQRSLFLDAMVCGMAVVAVSDAAVSTLLDRRTCLMPAERTSEGWAAAIRAALTPGPALEALRASARGWVQEHRLASAHVAAVLRAYQTYGRAVRSRSVVGGES